jgi:CDP-6-deoxy-D-xylo-4-hexulose-3-dehydrase
MESCPTRVGHDSIVPAKPNWPLMEDNITAADLAAVREFLDQPEVPILTQSRQVAAFERAWSDWLGARHSVMVNSGSSANLITLAALRWQAGPGEIIVPPLTWVSDIAAVLHNGFTPVFADIHPQTLGLDPQQVLRKITPRTRAVFITHVLGFNALTDELLEELRQRGIPLIEDVCEAHGATHRGARLGTLGLMSNFSFYYAHHLSTIEGGMVSTNDSQLYQRLRMLRSHGLVREASDEGLRAEYSQEHPDLSPDFIFAAPAYNVRSTEINAVIGLSQLDRLDANNELRRANFEIFLRNLDPRKYFVEFATEGSCNYAFTLLLREPDPVLWESVSRRLRQLGVEFRRGMSGGGNQLRQPYLRQHVRWDPADFPNVEHVHFYGCYLGNHPRLKRNQIVSLCEALNELP